MKNIISFAFIVLSSIAFAQEAGQVNVVGKNYILNSAILEEDRSIQIYTPPSYEGSSEKSYPVMYVLDGQEYFLTAVAYQQMLFFRDKTPPFIVIGINTDRQKRRQLFYDESEKFIGFIMEELIPYIDTNYRTMKSGERMFFGWEMAGGLGFELLGKYSDAFSAYMIASPTHFGRRLDYIKQLDLNSESKKFLFVTAGPEENWIVEDTTFISTITQNNSLNSRYAVFEREDHYSTPLKTMHEGLQDYFCDYKPVRRNTLKEYETYGGVSALRAYYQKRGERYNLSTDVHKETKHFLFFNAEREDNLEAFERFAAEFPNYLESKTRDFWFNRFSQFYIKHEEQEKAINLLQTGISKFPKSALLYAGLGDAYASQDKKKKALASYQNALKIDPAMDSLYEKIEALNKK